MVGTRCPVEASVRPGKPRFVSRSPGFAGARESGSSAAAAPQPGADDRTRRPPGRARRGSTGGVHRWEFTRVCWGDARGVIKELQDEVENSRLPWEGFFFFYPSS